MKIGLTVLAVGLFVASIGLAFLTFEAQTGQGCGEPERIVNNAYLATDFVPHVSGDVGFVDCIGPSTFVRYRPLDLSAVGVLASGAIGVFAAKRRRPKRGEQNSV